MEGLKKRAYFTAAILLIAGLFVTFGAVGRAESKTEGWMEDRVPPQVGRFLYVQSPENPKQTYRMDQTTYDLLKPFGIVSRVYRFGPEAYDVVVIASNNRESFHEPSVCFSGQGWNFDRLITTSVHTKTRGVVPVTLGVSTASDEATSPQKMTIYTYKGPNGFVHGTLGIKLELFKAQFMSGHAIDGVFYRFIPLHANATEDQLKAFVADFLDAANEASQGYF